MNHALCIPFRRNILCLAVTALLALASSLQAQPVPAIDVAGGGGVGVDGDITVGWQFDVLFPVTVAELGLFDDTPDTPLLAAHQVGIWSPSGDLLTTALVAADAPINGRFRYQLVDPVLLPVGNGYIIGALYNTNNAADFPILSATSTTAPMIEYQLALQNGGGGFSRPDLDLSQLDDGIFGPSFAVLTDQTPAVTFSGGSSTGVQGDITVGWTFEVKESILVAELGLHDPTPLDPMDVPHPIGLWGPTGELLAEAIVPVDAPERDGFRWVGVDAIILEPGTGYTIGGLYNTDTSADFPQDFTTASTPREIAFEHAAQNGGGGFSRPDIIVDAFDDGTFGPNFSISGREESALSFTGGSPVGVDGDITTGWTFDVVTRVLVGELGLNDATEATPLAGNHEVGLWSPSGDLLAQATVVTDAPWRDGFRWVPIDPIVLEPGTHYTLGALFNTNIAADFPITGATSTTVPEIAFGHGVQNGGGGLSRPTIDLSAFDDGDFGPNLSITRFELSLSFEDGFESGDTSAWDVSVP